MKSIINILLFFVLTSIGYSQTCADLDLYPVQIFARTGETVHITWCTPIDTTNLMYYRIRCANLISGPFVVCTTKNIPADATSYDIVFNKTASHYYFLTAWYAEVENGVTVIKESPGSNMIRIRWKP